MTRLPSRFTVQSGEMRPVEPREEPMTTAKLNTQHDYVSLRVTFPDKRRLTLTMNRWGSKASGNVGEKELGDAFDAFDAFMKKSGGNVGEKMEAARLRAERAGSPAELIAALAA